MDVVTGREMLGINFGIPAKDSTNNRGSKGVDRCAEV